MNVRHSASTRNPRRSADPARRREEDVRATVRLDCLDPVGYVNPSSCCSGVFVDQSAESIASLELRWWMGADES
jgi:hypothetical protein